MDNIKKPSRDLTSDEKLKIANFLVEDAIQLSELADTTVESILQELESSSYLQAFDSNSGNVFVISISFWDSGVGLEKLVEQFLIEGDEVTSAEEYDFI